LFEAQKQIFLSSDRPADEISKLETRLMSRFQWGLVIDVQPPDLETRIAILSRKAKDLNANIDQEIVNFLAEHVSTNIRSLEGALTRVVSYAKLTNQEVDINVAKMVMRDVFKEEAHEQSTSIDMIQTKVAEFFQLKLTDLLGKKRPANIAMPRQIAMYLCRCLTKQSLVEIGLAFGGRDHGTVIHACKSVENMIAQDDNIRKNVEYLKKILHK
jgi:chromosomal replication initiator protein